MPKCLTKRYYILFHYYDGEKVEGKNPWMHGDCSKLNGDCSGLFGECSNLFGNCTGLRGKCTELIGDLDKITEEERKEHPELEYWVKG